MKKTTYYTFEYSGEVTVSVSGNDTDHNYELALKEAVDQASYDICESCIGECINIETCDEEEGDY